MEPITDSRKGARKGSSEHDPADSSECSGLRAELRLEQHYSGPKTDVDFGGFNCHPRL